MSDTATTPYSNKCEILAELWLNYRNDEDFQDFTEYNDLGLPLAYAIANDIVKSTEMAQRFIEETFDLLLAGMNLEDTGFDTMDDILSQSEAISK
jgi:hypothetical protein